MTVDADIQRVRRTGYKKPSTRRKRVTDATNAHQRAVLGQQAAQANLTGCNGGVQRTTDGGQRQGVKDSTGQVERRQPGGVFIDGQSEQGPRRRRNRDQQKNADAVAKLGDKLKGQASAGADTFMGKLNAMKAKVEDSVSQFGQKYGPALQLAGVGIMALGSMWQIAGPMISAGGTEAGAGEAAALWPIALIVLGVIALIAIVYELWTHWNTVWGFIKAVTMDVWSWIVTNWPVLLAVIFGPIGIAAALIIENFNTIKGAALAAVGFIIGVWNSLGGFFAGLVGAIGGFFAGMWGGITGGASAAVGGIVRAWSGVVGFFSGIGSAIGGATAHMWDGILNRVQIGY